MPLSKEPARSAGASPSSECLDKCYPETERFPANRSRRYANNISLNVDVDVANRVSS